MRALHIAEIRGSWRAWLSVSLAFVATSFALSAGAIVMASATNAFEEGRYDDDLLMAVYAVVGMNLFVAVLVSIGVLGAAAQLVVNSRRPAIARLALAGATPGQIRNTLSSQLALVAAVSSIAGNLLALALQMPVLRFVGGAGDGMNPDDLHAVFPIKEMAMASVGIVILALIAGIPVASRATRIPPIEALRQGNAEPDPKVSTGTKVAFGFFMLIIVGITVGSLYAFSLTDVQKGDLIVMVALLVLVLMGLAMQRGAPLLMRPITKLWTALVPSKNPAWHFARHTVLARSTRLVRTVVPVMFAVGLSIGMLVIFEIFTQLIERKYGLEEESETLSGIVLLIGLAFIIALAGAIGNLLMMGRQRDAELALAGIGGATEDQQRAMVAFEGLIVGVTAVILGLIMAGWAIVYTVVALTMYAEPAFGIDWVQTLIVIVGALGLCVLATMLPALPTLRQPPQKVVARLIAD